MVNPATRFDLLSGIASAASALGIAVRPDGDNALAGEKEAIKAKWFLGGNKSVYRFSCRLDEPSLTATFRESIFDKSWGIAPPTLKVESYSQRGTTVSSSRREKSSSCESPACARRRPEDCALSASVSRPASTQARSIGACVRVSNSR